MELSNQFRVSVPVEEAWSVLTDIERIAPCMPGAELQEVEGDEYRGVVKVKVGPITAQYRGAARFVERDDSTHKAVLRAEGRDTRGQGNAQATVTARLEGDGDGTSVSIDTDLSVTGKVAQFGRGVLADVSNKLLHQFVTRLEEDVLAGARVAPSAQAAPAEVATPQPAPGPAPQPGPPPAARVAAPTAGPAEVTAEPASGNGARPGVRTVSSPPAQPVDLLGAAGGSVAKRLAPLAGGLVGLGLVWLLLRRRRSRRRR
ncbi:MAG TPA: SRPBCC family protein [Acidimicrobiales bacterium]|nr:SRPBCC family protein [Acidimicrobiales bacterium]